MFEERLTIHRSGVVHWGAGDRVALHAAPAWKLVAGLDRELTISFRGETLRARAILIPPDVPQAIACEGTSVSFHVEAGGGSMPFGRADRKIRCLEGRDLDRALALSRQGQDPGDDREALFELFAGLPEARGASFVDPRVTAALNALAADPGVELAALAKRCFISPVRLRHLVHSAGGSSLRVLRLWYRTMRGVELLLGGRTITEAALAASFSDHAHFTRSFARFIGRTPSSIHGRTTLLEPWATAG